MTVLMSDTAEIPGLTNLADVVQAAVHRVADDDDRAEEAKSGIDARGPEADTATNEAQTKDDVDTSRVATELARESASRTAGKPKKIPKVDYTARLRTKFPVSETTRGAGQDQDIASVNARRSPQTAPSSPAASSARLHTPMVDTPSARMGPSRSFSYSFARAHAPPSCRTGDAGGTRTNLESEEGDSSVHAVDEDSEGYGYSYGYQTRLDEIAESSSSSTVV